MAVTLFAVWAFLYITADEPHECECPDDNVYLINESDYYKALGDSLSTYNKNPKY